MPAFEIFLALVKIGLLAIIVGLVGWTIYFLVNRTDASKAPSDKWPEWYRNLVHVYPTEYSKSPTSNVIISGTAIGLFTAKTPSDCADDKKKGCSKDEDCTSFMFNKPSSNLDPSTCTTYSSISSVIMDPMVSGNTAYFIDGNDPERYYAAYTSNVVSQAAGVSKIPQYISTGGYFECASNCSSNALCTGFSYGADNTCIRHQALSTSNLSTDSTFTSYILKSGLGYFAPADF